MTTAEKYVAAAYLVVFFVVLLYVAIMSLKVVRLERDVGRLTELVRERLRAEKAVEEQEREREAAPVG